MAASVSTSDSPAVGAGPGRRARPRRRRASRSDVAVDEVHDVERRAVHRRRRCRDRAPGRPAPACRPEGGDDPVLAAHVVGGGEHVAERRAAQHEAVPVRAASTRKVRFEWPPAISSNSSGADGPGDVGLEPARSPLGRRCRWSVSRSPAAVGPAPSTRHRSGRPRRRRRGGSTGGAGSVAAMAIDVTDATFQTEVIERSDRGPGGRRPVGAVVRPVPHARARSSRRSSTRPTARSCWSRSTSTRTRRSATAFQVQCIPAVYALKDGKIVDGFVGRLARRTCVRQFVGALAADRGGADGGRAWWPPATRPASGRRSSWSPATSRPSSRWPSCSSGDGRTDEALALLARIPETDAVRRVAALARLGAEPDDDVRRQARRPCSTGSRTTTTPARSSSTSSR